MWRKTLKGNAFLHRWVSIVVGLVLVAEVFSGVILLFRPELYRAQHPELFAGTTSAAPMSQQDALRLVAEQRPDVRPEVITTVGSVYQVEAEEYTHQVYVDPGAGEILGDGHNTRGWLGWLLNMHDCAFGCEGYAGYLPALAATVPGTGIQVGFFLLGVVGLAFVWLCLSGIVAWWPGFKRFVSGFVIHRGRGTYRFNRDLHDVLGILAVPSLLMWSVTGAGYEFEWVGKVWYAVTGSPAPVEREFASVDSKAPDITPEQARRAAQRVLPAGEVVSIVLPRTAQPRDHYTVEFHSGLPANANGGTRTFGDTSVGVDRHTGRAEVLAGGPDATVSQQLWTKWNYGVHFGYAVPWGWRLVWLVSGAVPLVLAVTGLWTWWMRAARRARSRRTPWSPPPGRLAEVPERGRAG